MKLQMVESDNFLINNIVKHNVYKCIFIYSEQNLRGNRLKGAESQGTSCLLIPNVLVWIRHDYSKSSDENSSVFGKQLH